MFSKGYDIGIGFVIKVLSTGKESVSGYWGYRYSLILLCGGKVYSRINDKYFLML